MKRWLLTYILTENLRVQGVPKPRQNPDDFASPPWPEVQRPLREKTAGRCGSDCSRPAKRWPGQNLCAPELLLDRKSTRLNSSHVRISYAVFCLKKKKKK